MWHGTPAPGRANDPVGEGHLGRWGIGLYLGRATQPMAYGAAVSFAALLLWLYYPAQIFLFGADFTVCLGRSRTPKPRAGGSA